MWYVCLSMGIMSAQNTDLSYLLEAVPSEGQLLLNQIVELDLIQKEITNLQQVIRNRWDDSESVRILLDRIELMIQTASDVAQTILKEKIVAAFTQIGVSIFFTDENIIELITISNLSKKTKQHLHTTLTTNYAPTKNERFVVLKKEQAHHHVPHSDASSSGEDISVSLAKFRGIRRALRTAAKSFQESEQTELKERARKALLHQERSKPKEPIQAPALETLTPLWNM